MDTHDLNPSASSSGTEHALPPFPVLLRVSRLDIDQRPVGRSHDPISAKSVRVVASADPTDDVSLPSEPVRSWLGALGIALVWFVVLALPIAFYFAPGMTPRVDSEPDTRESTMPPPEPTPMLEVVTEPNLIPIEEPVSRGAMLEPIIIPIDRGDEP